MTEEQRELVNQLFAVVTALLEDAIEAAAAGQSPALDARGLEASLDQLHTCICDITALSQAVAVIAKSGENRTAPKHKSDVESAGL